MPLAVPETSEPIVDTAPLTPEPAPAEAAADALGDRYGDDDLFTAPPSEQPTTAEPDPAPAPAEDGDDDLFDEPAAPTSEDTIPESILPEPNEGEPKPEDAEPQPADEEDDIFDTVKSAPAAEQQTEQLPEDPEFSSPAELDDSFDPFGEVTTDWNSRTAALGEAGGLRSKMNRTWTDHTATYQCQARLLSVTAESVVLQRTAGAQLVVPFTRLAIDDLQFVHRQITALRVARARDATAEKLAVTWAR